MPKVIHLSKPLVTAAGDTRTLELRDPVAADFFELNKLPVTTVSTAEGEVRRPDFKAVAQWLSRLSGVDDILLGKMNVTDFTTCMGGLIEHLAGEVDTLGNSTLSSKT